MNEKQSWIRGTLQLAVLIAGAVIAIWSAYNIAAAWRSGVYRYMYIPPERIRTMEFSDSVHILVNQLVNQGRNSSHVPQVGDTLDSLVVAFENILNDTTKSFGVWAFCAEEGARKDSFLVTLIYGNKDIMDWKFIPEENFCIDPRKMHKIIGSDKFQFSIRSLKPGKPICAAIVQENATQGPNEIEFDPAVGGIVPVGVEPPFWYGKIWYVIFFMIGFATAWHLSRERIQGAVRNYILDFLTRK